MNEGLKEALDSSSYLRVSGKRQFLSHVAAGLYAKFTADLDENSEEMSDELHEAILEELKERFVKSNDPADKVVPMCCTYVVCDAGYLLVQVVVLRFMQAIYKLFRCKTTVETRWVYHYDVADVCVKYWDPIAATLKVLRSTAKAADRSTIPVMTDVGKAATIQVIGRGRLYGDRL